MIVRVAFAELSRDAMPVGFPSFRLVARLKSGQEYLADLLPDSVCGLDFQLQNMPCEVLRLNLVETETRTPLCEEDMHFGYRPDWVFNKSEFFMILCTTPHSPLLHTFTLQP